MQIRYGLLVFMMGFIPGVSAQNVDLNQGSQLQDSLEMSINTLALSDDGKIIALDKNEETNKVALDFFKKANQDHKIKTLIKPALESLDEIKNEKFDLVFIDADKMNYIEYYEHSLELLNKNSLIIIDNVLWYGEVVNENNNDKFTKNIKEFNDHISKDTRVEKLIIPLGDGMS